MACLAVEGAWSVWLWREHGVSDCGLVGLCVRARGVRVCLSTLCEGTLLQVC